ncbi:MAG: multidrug efflux system membrane fusion protein [Kangiellaceae bacterium]|jgi:multidrug efflux system membrane fusion protein
MKPVFVKILILLAMLTIGFGIMGIIHAVAEEAEEKIPVDTRPVISVESLVAIDHQIEITSFGELKPLESTELSAQVSGEVLSWNENFVAGGVVKRDEVLFTIEADTYEAAVLQAEAQISLAQATLIEEQARQQVAKREARNLPQSQVSDLYLRKPQVISAQAQLKSAEASLRIANRNLAKTQVRAPYDALVISRDVGTGQFVSTGMKVAHLNNIETAEITIPIAGFDSGFIQDSIQNIVATVSTIGKTNTVREGIVHRNLGVVDQNTRMQHLVVRIQDPYGIENGLSIIKFGTYVQVKFAGKVIKNVFKVPQALVNNRKVWLVGNDSLLESHEVEVVREEGTFFFISSGISERDRLVKNLPEYPQNGMEVNILGESTEFTSGLNSANGDSQTAVSAL